MNRRFQFIVVGFSSTVVALLLFGAVGRSASPDSPYTNLGVYSEVLSRIKADYVEEPDMKSVTLGAVKTRIRDGLIRMRDCLAVN